MSLDQRPTGSVNFEAVLLGERQQTDLAHGPQITRRELERDKAAELRNPKAPALHVDVLPTYGLDVGVRHVAGTHASLACNFAAGHGGRANNPAGWGIQPLKRVRMIFSCPDAQGSPNSPGFEPSLCRNPRYFERAPEAS